MNLLKRTRHSHEPGVHAVGKNGPVQVDPARARQLRNQAETEARRRIELDNRVLELQESLCAAPNAQCLVIAVCPLYHHVE
jgi:hypothetical protein